MGQRAAWEPVVIRLASIIDDYWDSAFAGEAIVTGPDLALTVNPALDDARRVMLLDRGDGPVRATLTPGLADRCGLRARRSVTLTVLRHALADAGVGLHDPDRVFYLPADAVSDEESAPSFLVRRLSTDDRPAFEAFEAASPWPDRDEAFVDLRHMVVFGGFEDGKLVSAASLYPWGRSQVADLGILTRPDARNRGYGRRVTRALCLHARGTGYEAQYRCRTDNGASLAVAAASGLVPFGDWQVAVSD